MKRRLYSGAIVATSLWLVGTATAEAQCKGDAECPDGRVCEHGFCVPVPERRPAAPPAESADPSAESAPSELEPPDPSDSPPAVSAPAPADAPEVVPPPPAPPPPPAAYPSYVGVYDYPPGGLDPRLLPAEVTRRWEEGDPIPPGYGTTLTVHKPLVIAGAVTLGAFWLGSITASAMLQSRERSRAGLVVVQGNQVVELEDDGFERWGALMAPVIGPFITMGTCDEAGAIPWLAADGVVQLGGLSMLIAGLALKQPKLKWVGEMELVPLVGQERGAALTGRF